MPRQQDLAANGVLGHSACGGCGAIHPHLLLQRLGGRCFECRMKNVGELDAHLVRLGRYNVPVRAKKKVRKGRGSRETDKLAAKAREHASKRLRTYFPDIYEVILCEERQKLDLEPVPIAPSCRVVSEEGFRADIAAAKRLSGPSNA